MNILIKSSTIVDPTSEFNGKTADVLIENGKITKIASSIQADVEQIDGKGKYLAPGFFDLHANLGEIGVETKEDFITGSAAAAAGGFTGLGMMPNTDPAVDSKSQVEYLKNRAKGLLVDIYPYGTISQKREGKDLAELYDMTNSGAIAFSDGNVPVQDAGLMERAMLYAKGFDALVISYPEDKSIAGKAKMNEGAMSTYLGMKGIPNIAEELMIVRDLYLAEYTDAKLHFTTISTAHAVELIKQAKKKGLKVTCDVAAHHLVLTEDALVDFDSNYKVKPPLRTKADVKALLKGIQDGVIDAVVSQHTPQEIEFKAVEFEIATYGMVALQTVLPLLIKAGLKPEQIVEKLSVKSREILGLAVPEITEGALANLVLFDDSAWTYTAKNNYSKSSNSPFIGKELKGKVWVTINNGQIAVF
ncbi:dihydroorotase, multifunctional complex type [Pseudopedobacter saltans DSM 12145]|uniref:Dihydroorotase, multifunctional complex type n=1 Tax=Pseudopedobacter saltans (strain ATCC 51119 / DSM 12145 / JCM 21818 / CCUG 39354 / LMG 10337 / NBRC 100064 / NCIMB 13643) TaxID=762903 RepID=F0S7F9_PSESL|nr:dihydroorotase [Pseudopedobacter saltans]ADY51184.1 dihydroorotase, multifunctional complex type [Pseudopedobacter saltans DSM 12145]